MVHVPLLRRPPRRRPGVRNAAPRWGADGWPVLGGYPQGDYDGDLDVDGADFLAWQQNLGSQADYPAADGNDDGDVNGRRPKRLAQRLCVVGRSRPRGSGAAACTCCWPSLAAVCLRRGAIGAAIAATQQAFQAKMPGESDRASDTRVMPGLQLVPRGRQSLSFTGGGTMSGLHRGVRNGRVTARGKHPGHPGRILSNSRGPNHRRLLAAGGHRRRRRRTGATLTSAIARRDRRDRHLGLVGQRQRPADVPQPKRAGRRRLLAAHRKLARVHQRRSRRHSSRHGGGRICGRRLRFDAGARPARAAGTPPNNAGADDIYSLNGDGVGGPLNSYSFPAFTVEASFKIDALDRFQIIVGKDDNPDAAPG